MKPSEPYLPENIEVIKHMQFFTGSGLNTRLETVTRQKDREDQVTMRLLVRCYY